jgi:hypothetical protein
MRSTFWRTLSPDANLEDVKRQARYLFHALLERNAKALQLHQSIDPLASMFKPRLTDAQYLVARQHGYASWRILVDHLEGRSRLP